MVFLNGAKSLRWYKCTTHTHTEQEHASCLLQKPPELSPVPNVLPWGELVVWIKEVQIGLDSERRQSLGWFIQTPEFRAVPMLRPGLSQQRERILWAVGVLACKYFFW